MQIPDEWRLSMKLGRIAAITVVVWAMFGTGWYFGQREVVKVHAQSQITIPKAWGTLKATALNGAAYVFEGSDGTIRVVQMDNGNVLASAARK
jgi:hypothetical protein